MICCVDRLFHRRTRGFPHHTQSPDTTCPYGRLAFVTSGAVAVQNAIIELYRVTSDVNKLEPPTARFHVIELARPVF